MGGTFSTVKNSATGRCSNRTSEPPPIPVRTGGQCEHLWVQGRARWRGHTMGLPRAGCVQTCLMQQLAQPWRRTLSARPRVVSEKVLPPGDSRTTSRRPSQLTGQEIPPPRLGDNHRGRHAAVLFPGRTRPDPLPRGLSVLGLTNETVGQMGVSWGSPFPLGGSFPKSPAGEQESSPGRHRAHTPVPCASWLPACKPPKAGRHSLSRSPLPRR